MEVDDDADIKKVEELDRSRQKGISLTFDNLYNRLLKVDPKLKIKRTLVQFWLMSMGEQNLKNMNDRQIGKIKWNDNAFNRYKGFDKETRAFGNRKIVHMDDVDKTIVADEYEKVPLNIAQDTFFNYLKKRYVGISRRAAERFLKLQPSYQKSRERIIQSQAKSLILNRPFERCLIDLIDTKKISEFGNTYPFTLTCIDGFSKFVYAEPLTSKSGSVVQKAFAKILERVPKVRKQCQSDNGSEFTNFPKTFPKIKFIFSSPYLPQSNAVIERIHSFLKRYIYWAQEKKKFAYPKQLQNILDLYNDRKHTITKIPPNELHVVNLSETTIKIVKKRIERKAKKVNPPKVSFPKLEVGDYVRLVILRKSTIEKIYQQWSNEVYEVSSVRKDDTYKVRDIGGKNDGNVRPYIYRRDYLKKVPTETEEQVRKDAKTKVKRRRRLEKVQRCSKRS